MEQSLGLGKPHSQYVVSDVIGIETALNSSSKCKFSLFDCGILLETLFIGVKKVDAYIVSKNVRTEKNLAE